MITSAVVGTGAASRPTSLVRPGMMAALLLLLPMFLQSFYYVTDVYPLYVLSKAWPLLTLPVALLGLLDRPRFGGLLLVVLGYTVLVSPIFGMIYFDQGYLSAVTAVVKVLPFTYYFSFIWLLNRLRPRAEELSRAFFILGAFTFALLAVLWVVLPNDAYKSNAPGELGSQIFLWEQERGNRIVLPLVFGILFLFLQGQLAMRRHQYWRLAVVAAAIVLLLIAFKQRTVILCIVAVLGWILFSQARLAARIVLVYGGALAACGLGLVLVMQDGELGLPELGGSLSVRQFTLDLATGFLNDHPLGWLLGVGALTRAGEVSFQEYFEHPNFYLADLGWIGIIFEYGLLGAALILAVYLTALRTGMRMPAGPRDGLVPALTDGLRYMLLASPILSAIWAPGEVCSILAIFVYLQRQQAERAG